MGPLLGQLVGVLWAMGAWTAQRSRVGRRRAGERRLAVVRLMCVGSVAVLGSVASWRVTAFVVAVAVAADAIYICYSRLLVRTHKYYQELKPRPACRCVQCMRRPPLPRLPAASFLRHDSNTNRCLSHLNVELAVMACVHMCAMRRMQVLCMRRGC